MVSSGRVLVLLDLDEFALRARVDSNSEARIASVRAALEHYLSRLHAPSRWNVIVAREQPVVWNATLNGPVPELPGEPKAGVREAAARKELEKLPTRAFALALHGRSLDAELGSGILEKRPEAKPLWRRPKAAWHQAKPDMILLVSDGLHLVPEDDLEMARDEHETSSRSWAESLDEFHRERLHAFALGTDAPRLRTFAARRLEKYRTVP